MTGRAKQRAKTSPAVRFVEIAALVCVGVAIVWWAIVYAQVMDNTGFPLQRTLPCLLYTSDRCSLAMALCKDWHFLGIKRYSAELLWVGTTFATIALLLGGSNSRPRNTGTGDQA